MGSALQHKNTISAQHQRRRPQTPVEKKKKKSHRWDYKLQRLGLMSCCQVWGWRLVSCWVWCSFAEQTQVNCPTAAGLCPSGLACSNTWPSFSEEYNSTPHVWSCSLHVMLLKLERTSNITTSLWVNRANLQRINEKRRQTEAPIHESAWQEFSHSAA